MPPTSDDERTRTALPGRAEVPLTRRVEVHVGGRPEPYVAREGVVRLGRDASNEVVIEDPFVSRIHLEVRIYPHGVELVDLDTKNGTHFQGARIRELAVRDEAALLLGRQVHVRVRVVDDPQPAAPAQGPEPKAPTSHPPPGPSRPRETSELVGASPMMQRLRGAIEKLGASTLTVLVEGETGTGKEVVARALHARSTRAQRPLVVFDCAAVSPSLIASELFGHLKGAFTGAVGSSEGAFRRADGSTLFLDEIGELPLDLQPALLRALEARQVKPVGASDYRPVDVRVIAATNRNLEAEVAAGRFRQDLLFRLAVGRLRVPPLRARPDDIPTLASHFARLNGATLSERVLSALQTRPWPGNVRELRNAVERAVMLAGGSGARVDSLDDLDALADDGWDSPSQPRASDPGDGNDEVLRRSFQDAKQLAVDAFERDYLLKLFDAAGQNLSEAARRSGVDRRYLRELFKKHGLDPAALRARKPSE